MDVNRRDFMKLAAVAGAASVIGPEAVQASTEAKVSDATMGVLVDITKCIGCRRCEYACKEAAQKASAARGETKQAAWFKPGPLKSFEDKSVFDNKGLRRPEPRAYTRISRFPNPEDESKPVYVKYNCLHCNQPACVSACIVGAFQKLEDGAVVYDAWKCIGCRYCMVACPFGIPTYEYDNALTPQVRKCTLCMDEGNPYKGRVPACVTICPSEVLTFGKRMDLLAMAHELIDRKPDVYLDEVYGEHEVGGTSWMYLAPKTKPFVELGFLDLPDDPPPLRTERIQHGVFKYFIPPLALYGLLGAAMWVSRPEADAEKPR